MHSALVSAQLAHIGIDLLDAVFEVIPWWIPNHPACMALRQRLLHKRVVGRQFGAAKLPKTTKISHP